MHAAGLKPSKAKKLRPVLPRDELVRELVTNHVCRSVAVPLEGTIRALMRHPGHCMAFWSASAGVRRAIYLLLDYLGVDRSTVVDERVHHLVPPHGCVPECCGYTKVYAKRILVRAPTRGGPDMPSTTLRSIAARAKEGRLVLEPLPSTARIPAGLPVCDPSPDAPPLTVDVLSRVFANLDLTDVGRAAQVCTVWRRASLRPDLWRVLVMRLVAMGQLDATLLEDQVPLAFTNPRRLILSVFFVGSVKEREHPFVEASVYGPTGFCAHPDCIGLIKHLHAARESDLVPGPPSAICAHCGSMTPKTSCSRCPACRAPLWCSEDCRAKHAHVHNKHCKFRFRLNQ